MRPNNRFSPLCFTAMFAISVVSGGLLLLFQPNGPRWTGVLYISQPEISGLRERSILVDARSAGSRSSVIPGAIVVDEQRWEVSLGLLLDAYVPSGVFIVFCDGTACQTGLRVANRIEHDLGLPVYYFRGRIATLRSGGSGL